MNPEGIGAYQWQREKGLLRVVQAGALALAWMVATSSPGEGLTLSDAVSQALMQNPSLRESNLSGAIMHARKVQAMGAYLPALSISESAISTTNPLTAFGLLLNEGVVQSGQLSNVSSLNNPGVTQAFGFAAVVSETVFQGGKRYYTYQATTKGEEQANLEIQRSRERLIADVTKAYFDAVLAKRQLQVVHREEKAVQAAFARASESYASGRIDKTMFDEARLQTEEVKVALLDASQKVQVTRMALARVMGKPSKEIPAALGNETLSLPPGGVRWAKSIVGRYSRGPLTDLSDEALSHRPDYQASRLSVESGSNLLSVAHSGFWPTLSAQGIYNEYAQGINTWGKQDYTVMGTLSWSLLNGLSDREATERAHDRLRQALFARQDLESGISLEVSKARSEARVLESRLAFDEEKVKIREEEAQVARDRVDSGIDPPVSLLQAQVRLAKSKRQLLADKVALMDDGVALLLATGELEGTNMVPGAMEVSGK